jgi:hypothetical protein
MKAVALLCLLAVAASALDFQSVLSSNPFMPHSNLPVLSSVSASLAKEERVAAALQTVHSYVSEKPQFATMALSAGCSAAIKALQDMFVSGACNALPTVASSQADLGTFCTGTCATTINDKVTAITNACVSGDDLLIYANVTFAADLRKASGMITAICTKAGDQYCLPALANTAISLNQNDATAMNQQLTTLCNNACLKAMITAATLNGDRSVQQAAVYLSLLCVTDPTGNFCFPKLEGLGQAWAAAQQSQDFSAICDPCVGIVLTKMVTLGQTYSDDPEIKALAQGMGMLGQMLRVLCMKNNGVLCVNVIFNSVNTLKNDPTISQNGATCPQIPLPTSPCPSTCKSAVQQLKSMMGCCLPALFLFLNQASAAAGGAGGTTTSTDTQPDILGFMKSACGVDPGAPCSSLVVKVKFTIKNLKYTYYVDNKADVEARLKADLALNFGVTPADITIDSVTDASATPAKAAVAVQATTTAGLNVQYTITPASADQATAINTQITSGATVVLPSVAALPLTARDQPSQGVAVDSASTTSSTVKAGAVAVQASHALLAAAALVAFFAMRR